MVSTIPYTGTQGGLGPQVSLGAVCALCAQLVKELEAVAHPALDALTKHVRARPPGAPYNCTPLLPVLGRGALGKSTPRQTHVALQLCCRLPQTSVCIWWAAALVFRGAHHRSKIHGRTHIWIGFGGPARAEGAAGPEEDERGPARARR